MFSAAKFEEEQTTIIDDDAKDETGDSSGDEYSEDLEVRKERLAKLLQFEQMKEVRDCCFVVYKIRYTPTQHQILNIEAPFNCDSPRV